jgi:hypothetical protein
MPSVKQRPAPPDLPETHLIFEKQTKREALFVAAELHSPFPCFVLSTANGVSPSRSMRDDIPNTVSCPSTVRSQPGYPGLGGALGGSVSNSRQTMGWR